MKEIHQLFEMALGLGPHWKVTESRFEGEPKKLFLKLEAVGGRHWQCPECGECGAVHDTVEKRWRHLNFSSMKASYVRWCLGADVGRTGCGR